MDAEINVIYKIPERRPQNGGTPQRKSTWYMLFYISSDKRKFLKFRVENRYSYAGKIRC